MLLLLLFLLLDLHSVSRQLLRHVTRARSSPGMQTHREYDRLMAERGGAQQQQHKGQGQGSDKDKGKGLENGLVDKDKDMGSDKGKDKDKRIVKEQDQEGSSKVEDQGSDKDKDQDSSKYKGQVSSPCPPGARGQLPLLRGGSVSSREPVVVRRHQPSTTMLQPHTWYMIADSR